MLTAFFSLIRSKRLFAAVLLSGCLAAAVLIQQFYYSQWNALAEEKESELRAIVEVKAAAIASWRRERFGDVQAVSSNTALGRSVRDALAAPRSPAVEAELRGWLRNLDSPDGDCTVLLYDMAGRKRLPSAAVSALLEEHGRNLAMDAIRQRRLLVEDVHSQEGGAIHITASAPLFDERGQVVGAVSLQIDPQRALYKLVQNWPTPSPTGETLLVRRDGSEVTFLNELRHKKGTALKLRLPLASTDLPAALAASGREGIIKGTDYRGEPVLAAAHHIPDSPWSLVAKVDRSEIDRTALYRTAYFGTVTVLIVMVCGFSLLLGWSRSESHHYRQMYEAETEHRAVVSHYELIHQHANDIMLLVDESGRIVETNERACEKYGYRRDELLALNIRDLRDPAETGVEAQWRAAELEDGVVFETVHRRAGGAAFPVEVSSRVIQVDGHRYWQSIVRDISERKRSEQALLDARNQLETALDLAELGPAELDVTTGILTFSPRACAIFGFEQPQQPQSAWLALMHPEDRERVRQEIQNAIRQDAGLVVEYRFTRPDGRVRWASAKAIPITGPDGAKKRFSVTQDVTERKQAEQALRESEQRFRAAFEHAAVGMLVVDAEGMLRSVNDTLCLMLGYRREELLGMHFQDITHPDDRTLGADVARRLRAGELAHVAFEKRYVRKDGSVLWGSVSSAILRKAPVEFITQIQDVTERKQAEQALREKSARLEELTGALNVSHAIMQNPDGVILYWSRGAAAMYGWNETEAVGRNAAELLRTEFHGPLDAIRGHLERSGEWEGELRHYRRDGEPVVVASHWSLQRDAEGRATAIVEVDNDITALKRAEVELQMAHRERERYLAQLEAVLNNLTEGIVVSDLEGNLLHWNPAALALHGFDSRDDCRRRVLEFADTLELSTQDGALALSDWPVPRILRGETLRGFEVRLSRRGSDWSRIFSYAGALARDGNGQPLLAVLSITDVTASRAAEQVLRERESDLNRAQAVARMGSWRWDSRRDEFRWSDESYRLFGIAKGTPLNTAIFVSCVHPDDLPILESCQKAGLRGEPFDVEYRIVVDGAVKWIRAQGELTYDTDGRQTSGFGTVQDVTESRQAEDALKQALAEAEAARRLLHAMMEHIPLGIAVSDAREPGVIYMSRYAQDLVQRSTEELLDAATWRVAGAPGIPAAADELPLARARKRGAVVKAEEWMLTRRDGVSLPILSTAAPIRDAEGRIIGAVAAWQDMTERKRAELEIRQLNTELEGRVRDRTAQLEAANKELEAFSYSVSHDLRAPLRGIDGWSLALLEDYGNILDAQARQYLNRVRSETQRMGLLIDDLLQLSRVTRAQMRRDSVDLTSMARRIALKMREHYSGRQIEFVVAPDLKAEGDAGLLEVTLTNLFDNAAKFTRPRPVARIEFGRAADAGEAVFYVRDNGVGFDIAYADKLFGAFQRLHKASEFPGTGIGLATVQRVVLRHGGRIWAESTPDQGATFYFTTGVTS